MAVTATPIDSTGENRRSWSIEATADGDTTATIAHGLSFTPDASATIITPLVAAARISAWVLTSVDATNVVFSKTTSGGSGAAGAQVMVNVGRWHSIMS